MQTLFKDSSSTDFKIKMNKEKLEENVAYLIIVEVKQTVTVVKSWI